MIRHLLKTSPRYFQAIVDGDKTFEVRRDDRGYQCGDIVVLEEYTRAGNHERHTPLCAVDCDTACYTGRRLTRRIGFVFKQMPGIDLGNFCVFALLPDDSTDDDIVRPARTTS